MSPSLVRRFWVLVYVAMAALAVGCEADPDPCDPGCPPTNCGETNGECG